MNNIRYTLCNTLSRLICRLRIFESGYFSAKICYSYWEFTPKYENVICCASPKTAMYVKPMHTTKGSKLLWNRIEMIKGVTERKGTNMWSF